MGIHPFLGITFGCAVFLFLGELLFTKSELAPYIILLTAWGIIAKTNHQAKKEFLEITFGLRTSKVIRLGENSILAFPFFILLLYHQKWMETGLLILFVIVLSVMSVIKVFSITIPTPFSRQPFEFTLGFRETYLLLLIIYAVECISIWVKNYNLSVGSLLLVFIVTLTYYLKPEAPFYIWIFHFKPHRFLWEKAKTAFIQSTILILPILLSVSFFYPDQIRSTLLITFTGYAFLMTIILAKYAAYPHEINLPDGIPIAISVYFPPLLLAVIPYFYFRSIRKLKPYLP